VSAATFDLAAGLARSRDRCGLPPTVEDPAALHRVAVLLDAGADRPEHEHERA
jgi:hypothetical protein